MTSASVILATASDDAVTWGVVGVAFVALSLLVALAGSFLGRERDE